MAQHDYVLSNQSGASFRSDLNNALSAIVSQNSGAAEPSTTYAYQTWADTTNGVMKLRNGANSAWITLYQLDGEWSTIAFENGSAAAPSIYFKDSGTDTGFYSSGTDAVDISTGGTRRLGVASTGDVTVYGGNVTLNGQGDLRLADSDSSNWIAFQAPSTVASNVTYTLPSADGTANYVLATNGSGTLSWNAPGGTQIATGNTSATVVDTGSDGHFKVTTEGTEQFRVNASGQALVTQAGSASTPTISKADDPNTGIFFPAADTIAFAEGGAEAARIDSSGRLGIGTQTPGYLLDCYATADVVARFKRNNTGAASGGIEFGNNSRTLTWYGDSSGASLYDNIAASTRLAIDTSGRLLVGTSSANTSGNALLQVNGSIKGTITAATSVASTSGTSIDFTSIPSWVKRITVMFDVVSTNGTSPLQIQIGDAGGIEATNYNSSCSIQTGATSTDFTAGFGVAVNVAAASTYSGNYVISLLSGNTWAGMGIVAQSGGGVRFGAGTKTLSDTLTQLRITTAGGTNTFDAGTINILYEG